MTTQPFPAEWTPEWIAAASADPHAFGVHYYRDRLGCLRRAHLPGDLDGGEDADFGTALHGWLHTYHTSGFAGTLVLNAEAPLRSCSEVELAERYAQQFTAHSLGLKRLAETRLYATVTVGDRRYPIAGTLDLVTEVTPSAAQAFYDDRHVEIEPGLWLHDFKTVRSKGELTLVRHTHGEQAPFYAMLLREARPDWFAQLKGIMFHLLYRYVKPREDGSQFQTIVVPPPTTDDFARVESLIVDATANVERFGTRHVNVLHCFDWNRECPIFRACERRN